MRLGTRSWRRGASVHVLDELLAPLLRRTDGLRSRKHLAASLRQRGCLLPGRGTPDYRTLQPTACQHLLDGVGEVEALARLWPCHPAPGQPEGASRIHAATQHVRALARAWELAHPQLLDLLCGMPVAVSASLGYRQAMERALIGVARHLHALLCLVQRGFLVPDPDAAAMTADSPTSLHRAWRGWQEVREGWTRTRLARHATMVAWYAEQLDQCTCVWRQQLQMNGMLCIGGGPDSIHP